MKTYKLVVVLGVVCSLAVSCTKYVPVVSANFPEQTIYLPAAVTGNAVNGIYFINTVAVPGRTFRYIADLAGQKLNIPLAVVRSGADKAGSIAVNILPNSDTINKLLVAGRLPVGTELLASNRFTVANSVTLADGDDEKTFNIAVDLPFLLSNLTKKFAFSIGVNSSDKKSPVASTAVVLVDPAFLVPTATFTTTVNTRTVSFNNTSLNGASFVWNYGDGKPPSTQRSAPYTYTEAGTYTVSLVTTGALGTFNPATFTRTVTVL